MNFESELIEDFFLLTSRSAFTPTDIPGLALWLDASDAATITLDGSNNVSQWSDKSGNARHASQATTTQRPAFLTNGINGLPAVRGDGVDDVMTWTQFASGTIHNFYVVAAFDTGLNQYVGSAGWFGNPAGQIGVQIFHNDTGANPAVQARAGTDNTFITAGNAVNVKSGAPAVYSFLRNAATMGAKWSHGSKVTWTAGTGGWLTGTTQTDRIFRNYFTSTSFRIAELVCYTKDLSAGEEASLSAYFLARYGVGI